MDCQRRFRLPKVIAACALAVVSCHLMAEPPRLTLKTLYWPPYTAENLEGQGFLADEVLRALQTNGFQASIEFLPWNRILANAEHGFRQMDAFFPAYRSQRYLDFCELSNPIGSSPLGIIHHRQRKLEWHTTADLSPLVLGIVQAYANTEEVDALIQAGTLQTEAASSDLQNIIKVAAGRIDAAIMDRHVFEWLLKHEKSLTGMEEHVVFHPRLLAEQSLHLCVLKGPHQRKILDIFQ